MKTGNFLQSATLDLHFSTAKSNRKTFYSFFFAQVKLSTDLQSGLTHFSESKKWQKIFAAQTPQRKRGYVGDFVLNWLILSHTSFTRVTGFCYGAPTYPTTKSLADAPHCSIWGFMQCPTFSGQSVFFNIFQTGNRTRFSAQLAYGKMTFSNLTFMPKLALIYLQICTQSSLIVTWHSTEFSFFAPFILLWYQTHRTSDSEVSEVRGFGG